MNHFLHILTIDVREEFTCLFGRKIGLKVFVLFDWSKQAVKYCPENWIIWNLFIMKLKSAIWNQTHALNDRKYLVGIFRDYSFFINYSNRISMRIQITNCATISKFVCIPLDSIDVSAVFNSLRVHGVLLIWNIRPVWGIVFCLWRKSFDLHYDRNNNCANYEVQFFFFFSLWVIEIDHKMYKAKISLFKWWNNKFIDLFHYYQFSWLSEIIATHRFAYHKIRQFSRLRLKLFFLKLFSASYFKNRDIQSADGNDWHIPTRETNTRTISICFTSNRHISTNV